MDQCYFDQTYHPSLTPTRSVLLSLPTQLCVYFFFNLLTTVCAAHILLNVWSSLEGGQPSRGHTLKGTDSPLSNYQLPIDPELRVELHAHLLSRLDNSFDLSLPSSCVCCLNCPAVCRKSCFPVVIHCLWLL